MNNLNGSFLPTSSGSRVFELPEFGPSFSTLLGSNSFNIASFNKVLSYGSSIETLRTLRIPLPAIRFSGDLPSLASMIEEDKKGSVLSGTVKPTAVVSVRFIAQFRHVFEYLGQLLTVMDTLSSKDGIPMDAEGITALVSEAYSKIAFADEDKAKEEFAKLVIEFNRKTKNTGTLLDASLGKDVGVGLKNLAASFFYEVYIKSTIFNFLTFTSTEDAAKDAKNDIENILSTINSNLRSVGSIAEGGNTLMSILAMVSPATRSLYDYMDRLSSDRIKDEQQIYFASMDEIRVLFPRIYANLVVESGNVQSVLENSLVITPSIKTERDLSFPDALFLSASFIANQTGVSIVNKIGEAQIHGFSFRSLDNKNISYFKNEVRPVVASAARLKIISEGRRVSNLLDTTIPGLYPKDLPNVALEYLGNNLVRLLNCAIICHSSCYEADQALLATVLTSIEDAQDSLNSIQYGKLGKISFKSYPYMFKNYVDKVMGSSKSIFSHIFDHWQTNPELLNEHRYPVPNDENVKSLYKVASLLQAMKDADPGLNTRLDEIFFTSHHISLYSLMEPVEMKKGSEVWGTSSIPNFVTPLNHAVAPLFNALDSIKRQEWSPYTYSVGVVDGPAIIWDAIAKKFDLAQRDLPIVFIDDMGVDEYPVDSRGILSARSVLTIIDVPDYLKSNKFLIGKSDFPKSIHYYPYDMVKNVIPNYDNIVHPVATEATAAGNIARMLIGDFRELDLPTLMRHPNAHFFFDNLPNSIDNQKKVKSLSVDDLNLRYPNSIVIEVPEVTDLRYNIVLDIPSVDELYTEVSLVSASDPLVNIIATYADLDNQDKLKNILSMIKFDDSFFMKLMPAMSMAVVKGNRDGLKNAARSLVQDLESEFI